MFYPYTCSHAVTTSQLDRYLHVMKYHMSSADRSTVSLPDELPDKEGMDGL